MRTPSTNTLCWPPSGTSSPYSPEPSSTASTWSTAPPWSTPPQPARIQHAHAGGGVWVALAVDQHGTGLQLVRGDKQEVLLTVRAEWPTLPIDRFAYAIESQTTDPHRVNPAGVPANIQIAHAGEGQWLALVLDGPGTALEAITGSKAAVLAEIRQRHPDLPLIEVPFVREIPPGKAGDLPKAKGI